MTYDAIKAEFLSYIGNNGGVPSQWYIGITNDHERRLFGEHRVNKDTDLWIFAPGDNADVARRVEQYFLKLGLDGGSGGGNNTAVIVYAYRKSRTTNP